MDDYHIDLHVKMTLNFDRPTHIFQKPLSFLKFIFASFIFANCLHPSPLEKHLNPINLSTNRKQQKSIVEYV